MLRRPQGARASGRGGALLAVLSAALVVGCGGSSGEGEDGNPGAALQVQTAIAPTGEGTELIVEVSDPDLNVPDRAGNRKTVTLECLDDARAVVVKGRHPWPFTDTDGGLVAAHVHQPVPATKVAQLKRCRLAGTTGPLSGRVTGPGVR